MKIVSVVFRADGKHCVVLEDGSELEDVPNALRLSVDVLVVNTLEETNVQ